MDANAIAKALRCGNTIGGSCYAACKYRENGLCELTESQLRINAATLIETIAAENARLRADLEGLMGDVSGGVACKLCTKAKCGINNIPPRCNPQWRGTEGKA